MYPIAQIYEDLEREAKKNIQRLVPKRFKEKVRVENIIIRGTPYLEIIKAAKKYDIDLITIATHGRTGNFPRASGKHCGKGCEKSPLPGTVCKTSGT